MRASFGRRMKEVEFRQAGSCNMLLVCSALSGENSEGLLESWQARKRNAAGVVPGGDCFWVPEPPQLWVAWIAFLPGHAAAPAWAAVALEDVVWAGCLLAAALCPV